jgi:hypothetical protein
MSAEGCLDDMGKENMEQPDEPHAKRRSLTANSGARRAHLLRFAKGSVTRVKVHNFMVRRECASALCLLPRGDHEVCLQTYNDASFEPGPRLNLVLGPNGATPRRAPCFT